MGYPAEIMIAGLLVLMLSADRPLFETCISRSAIYVLHGDVRAGKLRASNNHKNFAGSLGLHTEGVVFLLVMVVKTRRRKKWKRYSARAAVGVAARCVLRREEKLNSLDLS
jgi:hypothetical protein